MDVHQRYVGIGISLKNRMGKAKGEYLRKVPSTGLRLATFHIDFANNVMFQLKLREDDALNLHLQIIKSFKCFLKPC